MADSRRRDRLSVILSPSPSLLALSHAQSRPTSSVLAPISDLRPRQAKGPRRSSQSQSSPSTPSMNPLLSGSASSDLPNGSIPPLSQPLRERPPHIGDVPTPHYSHSRRTTTNRKERVGGSLPAVEPTFPSISSIRRPTNEGKNRRLQVAESPKPRRSSEDSFLPIPALSPDLQRSPPASRNRTLEKRWASVDISSSFDRITDSAQPKQVTVSRSRSLWTHREGLPTIGDDTLYEETRFGRANPLPGPLAEKQRVMNVRRAKKMQQVFGSEPPQALFQVAQANPISDVERDQAERFDKRGSVSTFLSVSTANFSPPQPLSAGQRRFSATSTIAVPTPPLTPRPETPKSVLPKFERSFAHTTSVTHPAFSNMFSTDAQKTVAAPGTPKNMARAETTGRRKEKDFRQRRMRAAKLSKFFGVGYQDIEPHLAPRKHRTEIRKVEVAIDDRGGLPWDRHELRNLEMEDVIVRLRGLRSS